MFDHSFLQRIKHSECFLGKIDLDTNKKEKDKDNDIEKNNKI